MTAYLPPADPTSLLNAARRERELAQLASGRRIDLLVVGGGVTGAGVALDAASRGLSVALIEKHDLAFGTSRWSSKLVHGGLRYLAKGQVGVAWESAVERALIMTNIAPHLTRPMTQLIPVMDDTSATNRRLALAGLRAGDVMRRLTRLPRSILAPPRAISAAAALRLAPTLDQSRLRGGILGCDGQLEDDARLVVALARTAAAYGASILTQCQAQRLHPDGAVALDRISGDTIEIKARNVINATGVWAGSLDNRVHLRPSLGSHAVLRAEAMGNPTAALTVQVPGHIGRYVFAMPQPSGLIYAALTDEPLSGPIPECPSAPQADIDWILEMISQPLARPLTAPDAVGSYAGVRPLIDSIGAETQVTALKTGSGAKESADISRSHLVIGGPGEVITITGGKLTTYRRMAQDAVNLVTDAKCRTATLPLIGAGPLGSVAGLPSRLIRRFGTEAATVAALAGNRPWLLEPVASGTDLGGIEAGEAGVDLLGVELLWGVQAEGALNLEDLLERRTRVSLVPADLEAVQPKAAEITAGLLTHSRY